MRANKGHTYLWQTRSPAGRWATPGRSRRQRSFPAPRRPWEPTRTTTWPRCSTARSRAQPDGRGRISVAGVGNVHHTENLTATQTQETLQNHMEHYLDTSVTEASKTMDVILDHGHSHLFQTDRSSLLFIASVPASWGKKTCCWNQIQKGVNDLKDSEMIIFCRKFHTTSQL